MRSISRYVIVVMVFLSGFIKGLALNSVVADSVTRMPLPSASVFDYHGNAVCICDSRGRMPYISPNSYPITIRYLGFQERTVGSPDADTIFLQEVLTELPEVVIESRQHKILHLLAYVREYSTLSSYSDTVFLFREKMVDYMLPQDKKTRFKGWSGPRVLNCKSYYRFTDAFGKDSVSAVCNQHFSWSDWVGFPAAPILPADLRNVECGTDTLRGKYSPAEIWIKNGDRLTVDVDVLADSICRKWVPNLSSFFRSYLDFENFKVRFNYDNIVDSVIPTTSMTAYSFNIESNGRGHNMFMFNRYDEPFFVSTYAEIYIADKEFITIKEAKKWDSLQFDKDRLGIIEPMGVPDLQASVVELVDRVNSIDNNDVRQGLSIDRRLAGRHLVKQNIGQRLLQMVKDFTGISSAKMQKHLNNRWSDFRRERMEENNRDMDEDSH